jgi:hypothetical protein
MYIQYQGFSLTAGSRVYNFQVIEKTETRKFTVRIPFEVFTSTSVKLQDGPGICFARLEQEMKNETSELRVNPHISIGDSDIQKYIDQHFPRKSPPVHKFVPLGQAGERR